jgi:glutathione S-transferase
VHLDLLRRRADAYLKLNPSAVVPTLVHDGRVIIESTVICEKHPEVAARISRLVR